MTNQCKPIMLTEEAERRIEKMALASQKAWDKAAQMDLHAALKRLISKHPGLSTNDLMNVSGIRIQRAVILGFQKYVIAKDIKRPHYIDERRWFAERIEEARA